MDFAEHLGKLDVSGNRKVYYDRFLRNGLHFMEGIVILLKADDIAISSSLLATVTGREMKIELDDQSFSWSLPLNIHTSTFTSPLLRRRLHLVREIPAEKELDITI